MVRGLLTPPASGYGCWSHRCFQFHGIAASATVEEGNQLWIQLTYGRWTLSAAGTDRFPLYPLLRSRVCERRRGVPHGAYSIIADRPVSLRAIRPPAPGQLRNHYFYGHAAADLLCFESLRVELGVAASPAAGSLPFPGVAGHYMSRSRDRRTSNLTPRQQCHDSRDWEHQFGATFSATSIITTTSDCTGAPQQSNRYGRPTAWRTTATVNFMFTRTGGLGPPTLASIACPEPGKPAVRPWHDF